MRLPVFVCLSACLSVCLLARLLKNACMDLDECCLSTNVGTWTNWLTFEPDPDYSPDAGTGLLSPISYALQRGILLLRENPKIPRIGIGRPSLQRRMVLKWFYSPRAVGTTLLEVHALHRVPFYFVRLSVANANLSGNGLNGLAAQLYWWPWAAAALLGYPDHGCHRCFLPVKNYTPLAAGAYCWHP